MYCPHCGSDQITQLKEKTVSGYSRYSCRTCKKRSSETTLSCTPDVGSDKTPSLPVDQKLTYEEIIKKQRREINDLKKETLETTKLRKLILGAKDYNLKPPTWTLKHHIPSGSHGTATLFLSDLHWGETVFSNQVNGVNEFNLPIARERLKRVFDKTHALLTNGLGKGKYEGIVVALGGDMISGNIHEELRETNGDHVLACLLDLLEHLIAGIDGLKNQFEKIFVPCVVGNHGRLDKKPRAKGAVRDNFEWILYHMLSKHYLADDNVSVVVSESLDFRYRLHGTVYLLTHGDQFRGGSGISGPLTPWALGDYRKRKRQDAIKQPYDIMIFGHWHRLFWGDGSFICNGSLKGYDEYAYRNNYGYQAPMQALWVTHPKYGITFQMPVLADKTKEFGETSWVSISSNS